jgi:large subunit ribosomal protein L31
MALNLKQIQLGVIDPLSHSAWTGGKQKILDKGRVSKFNKKFKNFRSEKK